MRDKILIQSKLSTPRLHCKIVHRERLTGLLDEHIDKNLIILCAPAGFGKTTLILDYLSHQNLRHAWLTIPQKGIEDISSFFQYQVFAFRNLNKNFGGKILEMMKPYTRPKLSEELEYIFTASFVNEFRKYFRDDIILVIDDLHYIDSSPQREWLKNLFTNQFDNIPPNLHVIVATRAIPDINFTRVTAKRNVLIINEKELCFRKEETAALLEKVYKFKYDEKDIKLLEDNVKGWITGIHLLLQAYGKDFNKIKYEGDIAYEKIFDFFAQEIFDNLSPELQEFMMVTSLMDGFDIALSNKVLGINNSRELTDFLRRKNLFFQHVNSDYDEQSGSKSYSYHSLFKNFLTKRLKNVMKKSEVTKLLEKIAEGYETSGDSVTAVNYFLESGNYNKAVQLINTNFTKIRAVGKFDIIWKWFNDIPEDFINKDPLLLLRKGYLYFTVEADSVKSLYYAKKAEVLYKQKNNKEGLVNSRLLKSTVLLFKGNVAEVKVLLEKTLKNNLKPENEVKIYRLLYFIYSEYREHQKAKDLIEKAIKLCDRNKLDKSGLYMGLGIIHSKMELYENAIIYYKKELENTSSLYNTITLNCNIASTYSDMGSYSKALLYFNKAFKLMEDTYSLELIIHVPCQKALLLQRIGDIEKSTSILENIFLIASKMNLIYNLMDITEYLMINYYLLNDYDNCLKYLNLNRIYTGKLNLEYYKQFFQTREALFLMKYDLNPSVKEKLIKAYEYFDSIKSKYKNNILVWITNYYLQTGNQVMASKYLTQFLNNSHFRDGDLIDSRNVIDFAFSLPEMNQYKDKIHQAFAEFFDRLNIEGTSEQYKRKINHQIENLYDLQMTSFGVPEIVSRGVPVPESNWRKKKGKMILAYMMLHPNAKYCKDKLIDIFFPDAKPDTVEDSFKQAVFSIRNAIKLPYINILHHADKMLYLNPDCYFKSDAEEFNKFYNIAHLNERSSDERIWACKQAIGLYKGEFMEGNYEHWCEDIRNDFHNKLISTCELLLNLLRKCRKYDEIIHYSEILLKHDKLNEKAYLSLVEANLKLEKMKSAMESYSKMMKAYKEELSEYPDIVTLNKIKVLFE